MAAVFQQTPSSHLRVFSDRSDAIDLTLEQLPGRVLIASDTYPGQMNGVELSLEETRAGLEAAGVTVASIKTDPINSLKLPRIPEVRVTVPSRKDIQSFIESFAPHAIHIATEGPVGFQVRACCLQLGYSFTTSFHTMWPQYGREHAGIPESFTWKVLQWFHAPATRTMTRSGSMSQLLEQHGFRNVVEWFGGVDTARFTPGPGIQDPLTDIRGRRVPLETGPVLLYVGRVSKEKNLEAFLGLSSVPGTRVIVGDGSALADLMKRYPDAYFVGRRSPADLPVFFQSADVFVFPSKTDTFGRVIVEALACGTPVAAFPVTGPRDIITSPDLGALNTDLRYAIREALATGDADACVSHAQTFSTQSVLKQFISALTPIRQRPTDSRSAHWTLDTHESALPRKLA